MSISFLGGGFGITSMLDNNFIQPYTFTGREYDDETGLYFYRARMYDAKIGRFISKDPIEFGGGDVNLFRYVQNNPVNWVDPLGLISPRDQSFAPMDGRGGIGGDLGWSVPMIPTIGWLINETTKNDVTPYLEAGRPPGFWPGDKGADEWGRKNGVGAQEGRRRFHRGVKQKCGGSKADENLSVNPETGDVADQNGDIVGNLGDVRAK